MEAVAGLFTAGAVASTGGWVTTVAPAAASTTWSALQGAATAASVGSSLYGGLAARQEANQAAALGDLQLGQERLESQRRVLGLKQQWLEQQGAARVAFAASGVSIASGTPAAIEQSLETQFRRAEALDAENDVIRSVMGRARRAATETRGLTSLIASAGQAAGTAGRALVDLRNRG